eukprot:jgi/Mesvir1/12169/Mv00413-RA.1
MEANLDTPAVSAPKILGHPPPVEAISVQIDYPGDAAKNAFITYRPLCPDDLDVLVAAHRQLFPIEYEPAFYNAAVHNDKMITWAAIANGPVPGSTLAGGAGTPDSSCIPTATRPSRRGETLVGFITASIYALCNNNSDLLGFEFSELPSFFTGSPSGERCLIYILTLGVVEPFRKLGIASALITRLVEYARSLKSCRAVYLHTIEYNESAMNLYEKLHFQRLQHLQDFYFIATQHYAAFLYIRYVNGGHPPRTLIDWISSAVRTVGGKLRSLTWRA